MLCIISSNDLHELSSPKVEVIDRDTNLSQKVKQSEVKYTMVDLCLLTYEHIYLSVLVTLSINGHFI